MIDKINGNAAPAPACLQVDLGDDLMHLTEEYIATSGHDTPDRLVRSLIEREIGDYLAGKSTMRASDINNPTHYNSHPSGVECIEIAEHLNFCLGNAVKYIWRAGLKCSAGQDIRKAIWYLERESDRREREEI